MKHALYAEDENFFSGYLNLIVRAGQKIMETGVLNWATHAFT